MESESECMERKNISTFMLHSIDGVIAHRVAHRTVLLCTSIECMRVRVRVYMHVCTSIVYADALLNALCFELLINRILQAEKENTKETSNKVHNLSIYVLVSKNLGILI